MTAKDTRDKAKKLAQKVLDLPEQPVPVVSSIDWIRGLLDFNPVAAVRRFTPSFLHYSVLTSLSRRLPTLGASSPYWDGSHDTVTLFPHRPLFPSDI